MMATWSGLLRCALPDNAAEDSYDISLLLLRDCQPVRDDLIHRSVSGMFGLREGGWNMIFGQGMAASARRHSKEMELPGQLCDLEADLKETSDQWCTFPDLRASTLSRLAHYRESGFSRGR
jgi:arylsulfatase A